MTSSRENGPRHVGRVVDPLARDDGALEPEFLASEGQGSTIATRGLATRVMDEPAPDVPPPRADPNASRHGDAGDEGSESGTRSMRDRLLERAQSYQELERPSRPDGDRELGSDSVIDAMPIGEHVSQEPDSELQAVGTAARAPTEPSVVAPATTSPTLIAVFGTLLGLATVASLAALAMRFDARHPMVGPASSAIAAMATSVAPASSATSAIPLLPPVTRDRHKLPGPWRITDAKDDPALNIITGTIGDKPFLRAISDAGLKLNQAYRVFKVLKDLRDLDHPGHADRFAALVARGDGRVKAFEYIAAPDDVVQAKEGPDGLLSAKKLDLAVRRDRIQGAIVLANAGFAAAAERGGFERGIEAALSKAFEGHYDLADLEPGSAIRVIAQEVTVLGEFDRYAGVEAVEIRFVDPKLEPLRIYYLPDARVRGYYDARGKAPYEGGWRKPIDAPITSHFNPKRMHPILHRIMPHTGTDFGAPVGTPVGASAPGIVESMGNGGPSGNLVTIKHPGGIETGYAHLSRYAEGLKVGDHVKRLQVVGYVGSTGRSTGPHLHFSAKRDGKFFDAETLNLDGMRTLDAGERARFDALKLEYDKMLDAIGLPPRPTLSVVASAASTAVEAPPASGVAAPSSAMPPVTAPNSSSNPIYFTDDDLRKIQSQSDGDEVP